MFTYLSHWSLLLQLAILALFLFAGAAAFFLYRFLSGKQALKRQKEAEAKNLLELDSLEAHAKKEFEAGRYQLAEAAFRQAATKAALLKLQYRELQFQHHACVSMSRQGSGRCLLALQSLQKLIAEMSTRLPPKDRLLSLAKSNLAKIEKGALNKAAEQDFAEASRLYEAEKLTEAGRFYQQAYRAATHAKNPVLAALILNDSSRLHARDADFAKAIAMLEKARKIALSNCPAGHELPATINWNLDYFRGLAVEAGVKDLLQETRAAYKNHDYELCSRLASDAVSRAIAGLKIDHWLSADALHHRACVKMAQGFYSEARADFSQALAILSEWPEKGARLSELVENNLDRCRREMGF